MTPEQNQRRLSEYRLEKAEFFALLRRYLVGDRTVLDTILRHLEMTPFDMSELKPHFTGRERQRLAAITRARQERQVDGFGPYYGPRDDFYHNVKRRTSEVLEARRFIEPHLWSEDNYD